MYPKDLVIPNTVTSIAASLYQDCTNLETVEIPNSVTSIEGSAFRSCTNLVSFKAESGLTTLGVSVFTSDKKLTTLDLPSSITKTEYNTFSGCTNIKNITLGDGFLASITLNYNVPAPKFTVDDMVKMFNALGTVPEGETRIFSLGAVCLAKLSDTQKQIATDKGWTLA